MCHDLRLALRRIRRARSFSICVVLILAAGIGSTAAMSSVLNALAFRNLRLPNPDTLVAVSSVDPEGLRRTTPIIAVEQLARAGLPADGWCAYNSSIDPTEFNGRVIDAAVDIVTAACGEVWDVAPALGRFFDPTETPLTGDGRPLAVITHRFWQRMFDGAPDILGRTIRVQGMQAEVIGVMPEDYRGVSADYGADLIVPFNSHRRASGAIAFSGRLRDGASLEQLRAQVQAVWPSILEAVVPEGPARAQLLKERRGDAVAYGGGESILRQLYATPVRNMTILGAGLILLVGVNVGGLLLARVAGRSAELAAMRALGATPARLARPLLLESLLYVTAGAALGVPLAFAGSTAFATLLPWANLPFTISLSPDLRLLAGIVAAVVVLAALISLLPM